jgi:hypothetical protein
VIALMQMAKKWAIKKNKTIEWFEVAILDSCYSQFGAATTQKH